MALCQLVAYGCYGLEHVIMNHDLGGGRPIFGKFNKITQKYDVVFDYFAKSSTITLPYNHRDSMMYYFISTNDGFSTPKHMQYAYNSTDMKIITPKENYIKKK